MIVSHSVIFCSVIFCEGMLCAKGYVLGLKLYFLITLIVRSESGDPEPYLSYAAIGLV